MGCWGGVGGSAASGSVGKKEGYRTESWRWPVLRADGEIFRSFTTRLMSVIAESGQSGNTHTVEISNATDNSILISSHQGRLVLPPHLCWRVCSHRQGGLGTWNREDGSGGWRVPIKGKRVQCACTINCQQQAHPPPHLQD